MGEIFCYKYNWVKGERKFAENHGVRVKGAFPLRDLGSGGCNEKEKISIECLHFVTHCRVLDQV